MAKPLSMPQGFMREHVQQLTKLVELLPHSHQAMVQLVWKDHVRSPPLAQVPNSLPTELVCQTSFLPTLAAV